jgi:4-alpha-glucanotransferase
VYGKHWLEDFVEGIIASPRVEPMRYADFHAANPSRGIVYLPSVSYFEMGEWALPPPSARRYAGLVQRAKREGSFEADKAFIRGGSWRNFLSRYPEANWMHKRMEWVSRRFHALPEAQRSRSMRADLHLAQANDAYWHGLFGGIYLPHLRRNVFAALARCERAIDAKRPRPAYERFDLDLDDRDEAFLWCPAVLAAVRPSDGATLVELTHYGLAHNFCDVLARRDEPYFDIVRAKPEAAAHAAAAVTSIHDRVAFRSTIGEADLALDAQPRSSFRDVWIPAGGAGETPAYEPERSKREARFRARAGEIEIVKTLAVDRRGLKAGYELRSPSATRGTFETELNLSLPSCDGPGGRFEDAGSSRGLGESWAATGRSSVRIADDVLGGSVVVKIEPAADIVAAPLVTVSQSEDGFEKIMQAVTLRLRWSVELDAGAAQRIQVALDIARERRRGTRA